MTAALWYSFLRGNLSARFGDMAPPVAVLGAWLLSRSISGPPSLRTVAAGASAMAAFALTVLCTSGTGSVVSELRTSRLLEPRHTFARLSQISTELAAMPRSLREAQAADRMQAADYLYRCTRPADRVLVVGLLHRRAGLCRAAVRRWTADVRRRVLRGRSLHARDDRQARIPIRADRARRRRSGLPGVPSPRAITCTLDYDHVGEVSSSEGPLRVFVRRGRNGTPSGPNGLPCFG